MDELNNKYLNIIENNKDKLIKAFCLYYGDEYEEHFLNIWDKITFMWFIPPIIDDIYNAVLISLVKRRINITKNILKYLGFDISNLTLTGTYKNISKNNLGIKIDGVLKEVKKNNIPSIGYLKVLEFLFGSKKYYDLEEKSFFNQNINLFNEEIKEYINEEKEILKEEERYQILIDIRDYIDNLRKNNNLWEVVGSNKDLNKFKRIYPLIKKQIREDYAFQISSSNGHYFVVFPILIIDDHEFIHEVNHAFKSEFLIKDDHGNNVLKSGLSIMVKSDDQDVFMEEVLNDLEAAKITDIFHKLGGRMFNEAEYYGKNKIQNYEKYWPLALEFFNKWEKVIKRASITENMQVLEQYFSKVLYLKYKQYFEDSYKKYGFLEKIDQAWLDQGLMIARRMVDVKNNNDYNYDSYEIIGETKSGILRLREKNSYYSAINNR